MQPLLQHAPYPKSVKPSIISSGHFAQLKTKLDRTQRVPNVIRLDTKAAMAVSHELSTASQQITHPIIQQLQRFIQKATNDTGQAHREPASSCLWHGINLQEPAGTSGDQTFLATPAACSALNVLSTEKLQDVLNCLLLAEAVYRVHDHSNTEVARIFDSLRQDFPSSLLTLQRLQWSQPSVAHRYLLAESKDALYVAFVGTKQRRDLITNANIMHETMWPEDQAGPFPEAQAVPAAHSGFLHRSRGVPIEALHEHARSANKRLVLTGHSLGGAVSLLCSLDLLHKTRPHGLAKVACIGFATPAVGNLALADYVQKQGWDPLITNYLVPEDVIARLLPSQQVPPPDSTPGAASSTAEDSPEPTAPAPAHQMFAHHPALWASLGPQPQRQRQAPTTHPHGPLPSPAASLLPAEPAAQPQTRSRQGQLVKQDTLMTPPRLLLGYRVNHLRRGLQARAVQGALIGHDSRANAQRLQVNQHLKQQHSSSVATASSPELHVPVTVNNVLPLHRHRAFPGGSKPMYDRAQHMYNSDRLLSVSSRDSQSSQQAAGNMPCTGGSNSTNQGSNGNSISSSSSSGLLSKSSPESPHESAPGLGRAFWDRTTQLARLVSFPLRVSQAYCSYVPLGRQLYLEPQGITSSLQPQFASPETPLQPPASPGTPPHTAGAQHDSPSMPAAPSSPAEPAGEHQLPSGDALSSAPRKAGVTETSTVGGGLDALVQKRRELLGRLWMHRMPTYRARMQQILFAALGQSIPKASLLWVPTLEPSADVGAEGLAPSSPIAPQLQLARAETSAFALLSSSQLTEMLKDGLDAMADQTVQRWSWLGLGWWTALRKQVQNRQDDTRLQVSLAGSGLQHCTHVAASLGSDVLSCSIGQQPCIAKGIWQGSPAGCALTLADQNGNQMLVEVSVPGHVMKKMYAQLASSGELGLTLTAQSDFCSATIPVTVHSDVQVLQDRLEGMLAVCKTLFALVVRRAMYNASLLYAAKLLE